METTKPTATNTQLGNYFKEMDANDKARVIAAANKYTAAKRSCADTTAAYTEMFNLIKELGAKYGFTPFDGSVNPLVLIDEFAAKIEMATASLMGDKTYTCFFNTVAEANAWLANQNNLIVKEFSVETSRVALKIQKVKLVYAVSAQPSNRRYQLDEVKKNRFFVGSNPDKFRIKWQEKHPQFAFVKSMKYKWHFFLIGGGVGFFRYINEKYIVLYTYGA